MKEEFTPFWYWHETSDIIQQLHDFISVSEGFVLFQPLPTTQGPNVVSFITY